jgi:uncharacterized protein
MIAVDVTRMMLLSMGNDYVVLLRGGGDPRSLPISIGQFEAQSIAIRLNSMEVPRPLTHDLLKSLMELLQYNLLRVEICDLRDDTFYARLVLRHGVEDLELDSRPSDAVALALRCGAPILIDEKVMEQAGIMFTEEGVEEPSTAVTTEAEISSTLQTLQRRLARAVADEHYEHAAGLRDQIKKLTSSN